MNKTSRIKEINERLELLQKEQAVKDMESMAHRAQSITVGTCFGGTTELTMRNRNEHLWCVMQPVEVIELIHQLAANVGCHVALKPRKDFASWRDWRVTEEEKLHYNGWTPFVNDMAPYNQLGAKGMDQQLLAALDAGGKLIESHGGAGGQPNTDGVIKNETVATEKPKHKRSAKRAATTA